MRVYLTDPSPKDDSEWAENLLGLLEYARYRRDDARAEAGLDKAIVQLRKLRQSEPKFAPGLYNLAYVLTDKGRKRQAAGETEAAKTYFNEAHAVAREGIRAHEAQDKTSRGRAVGYATAGRALRQLARWEKGKYDEALHAYEQSIDADRLFIPAYVSQGMIHFKRRDVDKAIAVYQLAAELNPSPQTLTHVGAALRQNGRHKELVPMFEEAAELEPSAKAYTYWGMALRDSDAPCGSARGLRQGDRGRSQARQRLQPARPVVSGRGAVGQGRRAVRHRHEARAAVVQLPVQSRPGAARRRQARRGDRQLPEDDRHLS